MWVDNPLGSTARKIESKIRSYSYVVEVDGTKKRKHGDQLRQRLESNHQTEPTAPKVSCEFFNNDADLLVYGDKHPSG